MPIAVTLRQLLTLENRITRLDPRLVIILPDSIELDWVCISDVFGRSVLCSGMMSHKK